MTCDCGRDTYTETGADPGPPMCEGCDNVAEDACTCDELD